MIMTSSNIGLFDFADLIGLIDLIIHLDYFMFDFLV